MTRGHLLHGCWLHTRQLEVLCFIVVVWSVLSRAHPGKTRHTRFLVLVRQSLGRRLPRGTFWGVSEGSWSPSYLVTPTTRGQTLKPTAMSMSDQLFEESVSVKFWGPLCLAGASWCSVRSNRSETRRQLSAPSVNSAGGFPVRFLDLLVTLSSLKSSLKSTMKYVFPFVVKGIQTLPQSDSGVPAETRVTLPRFANLSGANVNKL